MRTKAGSFNLRLGEFRAQWSGIDRRRIGEWIENADDPLLAQVGQIIAARLGDADYAVDLAQNYAVGQQHSLEGLRDALRELLRQRWEATP